MSSRALRPMHTRASPARQAWTAPLSIVAASLLAWLPVVADSGWLPNFGLVMLVAWRLLRPDLLAPTTALPLGLIHDLVTGAPLGLSMSLWPALLILIDVTDTRLMWRDYWLEWLLAVLVLALGALADWKVADLQGARVPLAAIGPGLLVSALLVPIALQLVLALDRWRLRA